MIERYGFLARFLLLLFCLGAAAVNTGNNLLYLILSMMIAMAAVAFVVSARSLRRLDAELRLPDEVAAGRAFVLGLEARSTEMRLPTGWAEAEIQGIPGDLPALHVPALPPGGRTVVTASARAARRGIHENIALRLATTFPFGLFRRRRLVGSGARLVVTPRRRRIRALTLESPAAEGSAGSPRAGEGADLFNIRDYTTQDDARRIDWKASARLERPMLKEFEREQERILEIVLDERSGSTAASESFEDLVEMAASILDHCDEKGIRGRLLVPVEGGHATLLEGRAAMLHLAGVRQRAGAPAPPAEGGRGVPPRIILSTDPAARTRIHLEWAEPRGAA